jgi:hypothetical protein
VKGAVFGTAIGWSLRIIALVERIGSAFEKLIGRSPRTFLADQNSDFAERKHRQICLLEKAECVQEQMPD